MEKSDVRKYTAELLGTFALVFLGCGSAVIAGTSVASLFDTMGNPSGTLTMGGHIGYLGISFAFGLTVLIMVYAIGHISGCHINPAITIAMLTAGKIKSKDAAFYIIFQCIGAVLASGALLGIMTGLDGYTVADNGLGQNGFGTDYLGGYSMMSAFIAEVILTFLFLMVIFGSTSDKAPKGFAGLSIGMSLVVIHLIGIPITGTSVNPARSLGPAVLVGGDALSELWLFIAAPIIGAIIAALLWKYLFEEKPEKEGEKLSGKKAPKSGKVSKKK